ncbi:MAG: TetR/AcrR family transcriptional regulator [Firmicutes bacterium]|uniref:TetR/AcrR family transcriptional regulator n=1 Tax=Candidatus Onthovivens merdipullorum TaxID=2840889 RepID=A0A9D9GWF9_9BACL|nr:TetR/AcrR family transcriptional regulator [Candidatus Onthovivens merdipullorum]
MKKTRKEDYRVIRTKRDLVNSFFDLLTEKSYKEIKVVDICKNAYISKVTFYNYFKSKDDLLLYLFSNVENEVENEIKAKREEIQNSKDYVFLLVQTVYNKVIDNKKLLSLIFSETNALPIFEALTKFIYKELYEDYDSLISEDRKYITKDYFAAYYSGAIVGLIRQILKEPNLDIEKTKTIVLDLIAK